MPRKNLNFRSTKIECDNSYNHKSNYTSCSTENNYTAKDSLILWTDFCNAAESRITGLGKKSYNQVANDISADVTSLSVYAPNNQLTTNSTTVVSESDIIDAYSVISKDNHAFISQDTLNMCGDPCFWVNASVSNQVPGNSCTAISKGPNHLYIPYNTALNFGNASTDSPFSISIWYYPIDSVSNSNAVYNRGGDVRGSAPTIFSKAFQYALYQRECGKLEFVLYDVALSASKDSSTDIPTYDLSATFATLTVRSSEAVLNPGAWNHITVTYDGTSSRDGMKIYVNCEDRTNRADDPANYTSSLRTISVNDGILAVAQSSYIAFLQGLYSTADSDKENTSQYTAMHVYPTPLMFATNALPITIDDVVSLSALKMISTAGSQLQNAFLFDIAIWSSALSEENVKAVCDATRNCMLKYSDVYGGDSGYINLSPKIMKKIKDEKSNNLSVIDRTGDRSDRRVKERLPYNDQHSLVFGKRITDEFKKGEFKFITSNTTRRDKTFGIPSFGSVPNTSLWLTVDGLIKREQKTGINGDQLYDSALSFQNGGSIATVDKVNNAIMYYDLILGPHNQKSGYMNLSSPLNAGSSISISISTDNGSSYTVVKTHTVLGSDDDFFRNFYSSTTDILSSSTHKFRRTFKIDFNDIDSKGLPYQIKFSTSDKCWGIGKIDIMSSNENVRYPLLINHNSIIGAKIDSEFIATPHTRSDLTATARSVSGISDTYLHFEDTLTQNITPYNDSIQVPFAGNNFFDLGTDNSILPSFSSPLKDKTLFTLVLNSSTETDIGLTNTFGGIDEIGGGGKAYNIVNQFNLGHKVNAAWNDETKSWQALTWGFRPLVLATQATQNFSVYNKVAFSSIDTIATASGVTPTIHDQLDKNVLSSYAQPVSSFGFPVHSSFSLPGANKGGLIKLSDYITKPFALEKIVVEFDARFEFAGSNSESASNARIGHRIQYTSSSIGKESERVSDNHAVLIPSFYLLNVKENSSTLFSTNMIVDDTNRFEFTGSIENSADYNTEGRDFTSCELISYGQMTMFMSGASNTKIDLQKALDEGLERDALYDIRTLNGQTGDGWITSGIDPVTSSFKIEFPVRNMPKTEYTSRTYYKDTTGNFFGVFSANKAGGRSTTLLTGSSLDKNQAGIQVNSARGLINNFSAVSDKNKVSYLINDSNENEQPRLIKSSGFLLENDETSISPYILLPKDKLSLNFSYPVPSRGIFAQPGSTDQRFNKMTLYGTTKVHLYGSCIKEGKEFHENMNQALTTVEISEPIGCESVVDQFNISSKDEYYKTFVDRDPFYIEKVGSNGFAQMFSIKNVGMAEKHLRSNIEPNFYKNAIKRVGYANGSLVNRWANYQIAATRCTDQGIIVNVPFIGDYIDPRIQPLTGSLGSITSTNHGNRKTFTFPMIEVYNNHRRYQDEGQNTDILPIGKNQTLISREKYVFRHDHFGYASDLIETAKDSKCKLDDVNSKFLNQDYNSEKDIMIVSSPVSAVFVVSGSNASNQNKKYYKINASKVSNDTHNNTINSVITAPYTDL